MTDETTGERDGPALSLLCTSDPLVKSLDHELMQ